MYVLFLVGVREVGTGRAGCCFDVGFGKGLGVEGCVVIGSTVKRVLDKERGLLRGTFALMF